MSVRNLLWLALVGVTMGITVDSTQTRDLTANDPMTRVTTGISFFYTKHSDPLCQSQPHGVSRDYYIDRTGRKQKSSINGCLQASEVNLKLACKLGDNDFTMTKFAYLQTDTTCSNPLVPVGTIYLHTDLCFPRDGIFLKAHCGEDALLNSLLTKAVLVAPAIFNNKDCLSSQRSSLKSFIWFGVCSPYVTTSSKKRPSIESNFVVTLTSSTPNLKVRMKMYHASDTSCTGNVRGMRDIVYPPAPTSASLGSNALPSCVPYQLRPTWYYSNVQPLAPYATTGGAPTYVYSADDGLALCDFYNAVQYKELLTSWACGGTDPTPCSGSTSTWAGVTCQVSTNGVTRVTALNMWQQLSMMLGVGMGLSISQLPTSLGRLGELTSLALNQNSLAGTIPSQLGVLTKLQKLDLSMNRLTGTLPAVLGNLISLTTLNLENAGMTTGLTGSVPSSFCSFSTSISMNVRSNAALTCKPSCLNAAYSQVYFDTISTCA